MLLNTATHLPIIRSGELKSSEPRSTLRSVFSGSELLVADLQEEKDMVQYALTI